MQPFDSVFDNKGTGQIFTNTRLANYAILARILNMPRRLLSNHTPVYLQPQEVTHP